MFMQPLTTARPFRRTSLLVVVVAALLLAQTLGLLHRVAHAPHADHAVQAWVGSGAQAFAAPAAHAHAHAHAHDHAHDHAHEREHDHSAAELDASHVDSGGHWLHTLFGAHDERACASYDHGLHADFLWSAPAVACAQAWQAILVPLQTEARWAAQAAGYLARGPPIGA
ncbi:MAG: hypothetical protein AD742_20610 [Methylibium sp. NZG]|nr:MAG: hypothetical protein AD742_20610 [Methylibium sp. NZG]